VATRLVVLHIDGLSADLLEHALERGLMPFTRELIRRDDYAIHRYHCGLPSTTPFVQAGILYGDNTGIPSFRWWDREQRAMIQFGAGSTFNRVAHRYFRGCRPLTENGACIAACYPGGAADDFGIAYHDRTYGQDSKSRSALRVVVPYVANPIHLGEWAWHTAVSVWWTAAEYVEARAEGRRPARAYVVTDALEEIFAHHLTRYAVERAMGEGYSPIYAGFYAFDETAHAFGPGDENALSILRHVDHTIKKVAEARRDRYELVVLSDHGQIDTIPFDRDDGKHLGELVAGWMPGWRVEELKGKTFGPAARAAKGVVHLAYTGGLGHVYLDAPVRQAYETVKAGFPALVRGLVECERIALVVGRSGAEEVVVTRQGEFRGPDVEQALSDAEDRMLVREQLSRLNSFAESGDLMFFGAFRGDRQINFENQAGGHGAFGGEQTRPFVLARRQWGLDTSRVHGAHELHPIISDLRDRLAAGGGVSSPRASRP
jgi:Type I phosphodiesterase / nucleotide pyrophosphatase